MAPRFLSLHHAQHTQIFCARVLQSPVKTSITALHIHIYRVRFAIIRLTSLLSPRKKRASLVSVASLVFTKSCGRLVVYPKTIHSNHSDKKRELFANCFLFLFPILHFFCPTRFVYLNQSNQFERLFTLLKK